MVRAQILAIITSLLFLFYIGRLIVKGRLREEYSFVWIVSTIVLLIFSFWRDGLELVAHTLGVYEAPNLIFAAAIFIIMIYLLHLSMVSSKLQEQNKKLTQEIALLREKMKKDKSESAE